MSFEAVDPRARGLRSAPREGSPGVVALIARLDWVLLLATLATVAYGIWAINGITRHDPGGSLAEQAGALRRGGARAARRRRALIDPARLPALRRA